jgi:peptide-methionine (S)-S-oxide reductase
VRAVRTFWATVALCGVAGLALMQLAGPAQSAGPAAAPAASAPVPGNLAVAVFAGGCFWCTEADFDKVRGVVSTTSGYTGGSVPNPTYEQVSAKHTGHAEAVKVVFDPALVNYKALLGYYWRTIDPTTSNQQFCDIGTPYRSAIYAQDAEQLALAQASLEALQKSKPFAAPVVTEVVAGGPFYPAEEYHQDYYRKNPVRYAYYRAGCGRDARLKQLWGEQAAK